VHKVIADRLSTTRLSTGIVVDGEKFTFCPEILIPSKLEPGPYRPSTSTRTRC